MKPKTGEIKTRRDDDWEEIAEECHKLNVTEEDIEAAKEEVRREPQNES